MSKNRKPKYFAFFKCCKFSLSSFQIYYNFDIDIDIEGFICVVLFSYFLNLLYE
jgi:hypothetical protein